MFDFRRTHICGELERSDIGKEVTLSGWVNKRRDHGNLIFIDIRDRWGTTQLLFDPKKNAKAHKKASSLRSEYAISVHGNVVSRKEGMVNKKMKTGEIEVEVKDLEILSASKTPPFSISDPTLDVKEDLRLKYRYLDIRRGDIIDKLTIRHKASLALREFLSGEGFLEVETPILSKTTPEGARDYLVPSRIYKGNFYALPQSPQLFKQLLMISGIDRYFQIAKCFRDEDMRADRQPEFTQIDMEMSFQTKEGLFEIVEGLMKAIFKKCLGIDIKTPFRQMTYKECMDRYGSDKPDLRFNMELFNIKDIVETSDFSPLKEIVSKGGTVKALCIKNGADISRKGIELYSGITKKFGASELFWMKKKGELTSSIVKFFKKGSLENLEKILDVEEGDLILIAGGEEKNLNQALDKLRRTIALKRNLIKDDLYNFLWVVDFPMFSLDEKTRSIQSEHHPFTSPKFEDMELLEKDPLKTKAIAYDLVLNGYEAASGSQRIHSSELQEKIFKILKLSKEDIKNKFGYFIEALKYGTPPHLGIALGFDRIIMILTKTKNIRDVIAFPKTQKASDLMTQSPSPADNMHLKELKINVERENIEWL